MTQLIPFHDRDGYIWMDGEMKPWREAGLHVLSHGLHYGGCIFEGERVYDKQIFKLREHSERFKKSAEYLDFEIPLTVDEIIDISNEVVEANDITDGYVRPVAWRGSEQMAVSGQLCKIHVAFATWPWPKYFFPKAGDEAGVALKTSEWVRPDPRSMPVQSKSSGIYMIGTIAKQAAEKAGYDDALLLDYRGHVAESTGSNLFMIRDGEIHTPVPDCFLNGITRQTVIDLAAELNIPLEERVIMPEELREADEVFLTGTAAEIAPVGKIDDIDYEIGPVTNTIKDSYADLVRQKHKSTEAA